MGGVDCGSSCNGMNLTLGPGPLYHEGSWFILIVGHDGSGNPQRTRAQATPPAARPRLAGFAPARDAPSAIRRATRGRSGLLEPAPTGAGGRIRRWRPRVGGRGRAEGGRDDNDEDDSDDDGDNGLGGGGGGGEEGEGEFGNGEGENCKNSIYITKY